MLSDIIEDVEARVETTVTTRMDELKALMKGFIGDCATKQCVDNTFQRVSEVLSRIEKRLETLEKKVDLISSGVVETKVHVDDVVRNVYKLPHVQDSIMERGIKALKSWTSKTGATILYDSTVDPFTHDGLFVKVKGKRNIAIVAFTTDVDVFGGFYSVDITRQGDYFYDPNMFAFAFESRGRCATPQKFKVKEGMKDKANLKFYKNDSNGFVSFWVDGAGRFYLGNEKSYSCCYNMSKGFEGLQDTTLTGKTGPRTEDEHHCTRLVAIQLL